jgi:hypothetical protein
MQDIRNLSIEDLLTKLKEHKLCSCYETVSFCKSRRKIFEKRLFLHVQEKEEPPQHKVDTNGSEYFLLDLDLPQTWSPGKSILKDTSTKKTKKSVQFKQTEIFGNEAIYPYCVKKYNHDTKGQHLHAPECSNANAETVEVLGQYRWMNRKSLIEGRHAI